MKSLSLIFASILFSLSLAASAWETQSSETSWQSSGSDVVSRWGWGRGDGPGRGGPGRGGPQPYPGGPGRGPDRGGSRYVCTAVDKGWEEHRGGHRDCRECLVTHGNCIETCEAKEVSCIAEGQDYRGQRVTVEGRDTDRFYAERDALYQCQRNFANCRIVNCNERREVVSRRSCR